MGEGEEIVLEDHIYEGKVKKKIGVRGRLERNRNHVVRRKCQ